MTASMASRLEDLKPVQVFPYATFVKGRTGGDFKRHSTLAHARSAVSPKNSWASQNPPTDIFRWDYETQEWVPLDASPTGTGSTTP